MNYKITILTLVFSGLLLTACGGSSSSSTTETTPTSTVETTPAPARAEDGLNATWLAYGGCASTDEESYYITFTINSIDAIYSEKIYSNTTCNESDLLSSADSTFSLSTGDETKGSDRVSTIELDLTRTGVVIHTGEVTLAPKGVTFYSMYRIDTQGRLIIAEGTDIRTGATTEDRANDFTQSVPFVRQ